MLLATSTLTSQQKVDLTAFFTHSLGLRNLLNDYSVQFARQSLYLCERVVEFDDVLVSSVIPRQRQKRLLKFLEYLQRQCIINFEIKIKTIQGEDKQFNTTHYRVMNIDFDRLHFICKKSPKLRVVEKPLGLSPLVWNELPEVIQKNWKKFSESLRARIIECVNTSLPVIYANQLYSMDTFFFEVLKSECSLDVSIPVSFDDSGDVYQLYELLTQKTHYIKGGRFQLRDKDVVGYFMLKDLKKASYERREVTIKKVSLAYRYVAQTPKHQTRFWKLPSNSKSLLPKLPQQALSSDKTKSKRKTKSQNSSIHLPPL